jgi:hypothetical protein
MDFQDMYEVYTEVIKSNNKDKINEFISKYPNFYKEMKLKERWGL